MPIFVLRVDVAMVMTSPSLAPTWNVIVPAEPSSSLMPLKSAELPMRAISDCSWAASAVMAALSEVESVPLPYWTASSRTRCSIEWTSLSEPSAVCTRLTPS